MPYVSRCCHWQPMPCKLLTDSTYKLFEVLQNPWLWPTCTRFAVSWMSGIRSANPSSCSNSSWYLVGSRDFPLPFDLLILKTRFCNMKPEILTVALRKIQVFWDVILCHWVSGFHCFEGLLCLHLQESNSQKETDELLDPEYEAKIILQNVRTHSPDTASHPRRLEHWRLQHFKCHLIFEPSTGSGKHQRQIIHNNDYWF